MCEEFTYGGCDGNQNNFESSEQCNQQCNPNGMKLVMSSKCVYIALNIFVPGM